MQQQTVQGLSISYFFGQVFQRVAKVAVTSRDCRAFPVFQFELNQSSAWPERSSFTETNDHVRVGFIAQAGQFAPPFHVRRAAHLHSKSGRTFSTSSGGWGNEQNRFITASFR